jgi:hypothetical protein
MLPTPLQSLNKREGIVSEHPGQVTQRFAPTAKLSRLSRVRFQHRIIIEFDGDDAQVCFAVGWACS